jgi:hypothetical protein
MIEIQKNKKQFIECINILSNLVVDEISIVFSKEKIFIRAVHASNHCMIILNILPTLFEKYEVQNEIIYTLNLQKLQKVLKNITEKTMEIYPENDVLVFKDSKNIYKLNYYVGVKDERPKPQFDYKNIISLKSNVFFQGITRCIDFDQIGMLNVVNNLFYLKSKSHMIKSDMLIDTIFMDIKEPDSTVYFDFTYIEMIKNVSNIFDNISLKFDSEFPLSIIGSNDNINFEFILASRVSGGENE